MVRAECDTTQLFRCPLQYICFVDSVNLGRCTFLQKSFITLTTDSNYDLDIGNFCIAKIYRTSRWLGFKIIFDKNHSRDRERLTEKERNAEKGRGSEREKERKRETEKCKQSLL